jgi:hypothetical protein
MQARQHQQHQQQQQHPQQHPQQSQLQQPDPTFGIAAETLSKHFIECAQEMLVFNRSAVEFLEFLEFDEDEKKIVLARFAEAFIRKTSDIKRLSRSQLDSMLPVGLANRVAEGVAALGIQKK